MESEDVIEILSDDVEESLLDNNATFDPSDYLPRRTSRVSAHAASQAIKKSVKEEKADPNRTTSTSEAAREEQQEVSHVGKVKTTVKAAHKRRPVTPYDCRIKLVRCEEDPVVKKWMQHSDSTNKEHQSTYKVVYAPTTTGQFKPQANGTLLPKKESASGSQTPYSGPEQRKSKYLDGVASISRQQNNTGKPASLNVVVVHPKPGSKIVNPTKGRGSSNSKSKRLQELIADPNLVISKEVSRVMTTGGNAEVQCDKCSKTYMAVRDLINHKRVAHKTSQYMCSACASEFPSVDELDSHECQAKYRCDVCGIYCKSAGGVKNHKNMAHPKTLGSYMCQVCCFNASSQQELNSHVCGGRPKIKYSARASSAVMVFPTWDVKPKASTSTPRPNIYVNIPGPLVPSGDASGSTARPSSSSSPMQFLCEVCLNMYPSSAALASHKCDATVVVDADPSEGPSQPSASALPKVVPPFPSVSQPGLPVGMEVMPEVEQLAKFYSSVVFME